MTDAQYNRRGGILLVALVTVLTVMQPVSASADQESDAAASYAAALAQAKAAQDALATAKANAAAAKQAQAAAAAAQAQAAVPAPVVVAALPPGTSSVAVLQAPAAVHSVLDFTPLLAALEQWLLVMMTAVVPSLIAWMVYELRRRTNVVTTQAAAADAAAARAAIVVTTAGLVRGDIVAGRMTMADVVNTAPETNQVHPVLRTRISTAMHALHPYDSPIPGGFSIVDKKDRFESRKAALEADADRLTHEVIGTLGHLLPLPQRPVAAPQIFTPPSSAAFTPTPTTPEAPPAS
jgi:hypothetical protein